MADNKLFMRDCVFIAGAASMDIMPSETLPEVAFVGRSNVGKSSLINAITHRNSLARTSRTPGRTQQINLFALDKQLIIADLPGYGYAKAAKEKAYGWAQCVSDYLQTRRTLKRLYILIDSRHGLKPIDHDFMSALDKAAVSYQIVLTKTDKAKKLELQGVIDKVRQETATHVAAHPEVLITSARKKLGLDELRSAILDVANL